MKRKVIVKNLFTELILFNGFVRNQCCCARLKYARSAFALRVFIFLNDSFPLMPKVSLYWLHAILHLEDPPAFHKHFVGGCVATLNSFEVVSVTRDFISLFIWSWGRIPHINHIFPRTIGFLSPNGNIFIVFGDGVAQ